MVSFLHVMTVMLVALAAALSVAHALELPGKMRLDRETYLAVQGIYYPGFTIGGGIAEGGGLLATVLLLTLTDTGSPTFWLVLMALFGMFGMHAVFWLVTHPVNRYWLENKPVGSLGKVFFGLAARPPERLDWTDLRNRWEYSHLARAALSSFSLLALVVALLAR